jgi:hypothetical protein
VSNEDTKPDLFNRLIDFKRPDCCDNITVFPTCQAEATRVQKLRKTGVVGWSGYWNH